MKQVFIETGRCMGCKTCEIACAIEHTSSKNLIASLSEPHRFKPRVRVEQARQFSMPIRCQHCEDAPCIMACPTGAMSRETKLNAVLVNEDRCIGCWMCMLVCPFGAISSFREKPVALKCDFCADRQSQGLNPACVDSCPTQALIFGDVEKLSKQKRVQYAARATEIHEPTPDPLISLWRAGKYQYTY